MRDFLVIILWAGVFYSPYIVILLSLAALGMLDSNFQQKYHRLFSSKSTVVFTCGLTFLGQVLVLTLVNYAYLSPASMLVLAFLNLAFLIYLFIPWVWLEVRYYLDGVDSASAPSKKSDDIMTAFFNALTVHPSFKLPLGILFKKHAETSYQTNTSASDMARAVNQFMKLSSPLLVYDESGVTLASTIPPVYDEDEASLLYPKYLALGDMMKPVLQLPVKPKIPDSLRNEHHQIIGGIGHGKTSTLISLILDDVEEDAAMVVIDSQGDLIENLATRLPQDRVILVSPNCPPAMNPFATRDKSDGGVTRSLAMLNYVFSTGGMAMTARQSMVYNYLSRLCMTIPGASINTFRQLLNPANQAKFEEHIAKLSEVDQEFFQTFYNTKEFNDTRNEINTRISGLLQTKMFVSMFGANEMKLEIPQALQDGKIILVSTKSTDTGDASAVIGRLFIAQVMQAVRNRQEHDRKRVYLYVDEFADYADDSKMLSDCFSQGRKYNLAMVICFQILKPLNENVRAFISGCTSIKFAGGVSQDDIVYMAKQMDTTEEIIKAQKKLTFLAYFKGHGTIPWKTDPTRLKQLPVLRSYADIEADMRDQYGETPKEAPFAEKDAEGW